MRGIFQKNGKLLIGSGTDVLGEPSKELLEGLGERESFISQNVFSSLERF